MLGLRFRKTSTASPDTATIATRLVRRMSSSLCALLLLCGPLLLTGCLEIRSIITLHADGSGTREMEVVAIKRELDQLGPGAAREIEQKLRADIEKGIAQDFAGDKPQLNEYVDEQGNRVFNVKGPFRDVTLVDRDTWNCDWNVTEKSFMKKQFRLRCQMTNARTFGEGPFKIPVTMRIRLPGSIVSTNGTKRADNEAEWVFKGGWRRGTVLEASAEGNALPANMIAVPAGSLLVLAAVGAGYMYFRRSRSTAARPVYVTSAIGVTPGNAAAAGVTCPTCGTENAAQAKFCRSCGTRLGAVAAASVDRAAAAETSITCPHCTTVNASTSKFCRSCGTPLKAVVAPAAIAAAPASSREALPETALLESTPSESAVSIPLLKPRVPGAAHADAYPEPTRAPRSIDRPVAAPRATEKPSKATFNWQVPAIVAAVMAVLGIGGWFGYSAWTKRPPAQATAPVGLPAPAPQANGETPTKQEPPSSVTPSMSSPSIPMARDESNGCFVWKPNLQPNESVKWSGSCANSMAEGPGKAEWFTDNSPALVYQGTFKAGMIQGRGTMTATGGDTYDGEYLDGQRHGRGTYVAASGERYEGQWRANKREGTGTLTYANGDRYEGEFKDNKRHGIGTFTRPDGEKYVGEYREDRREGQGTLVRADGARYEGMFKDGKPLGSLTPPVAIAKAPAPLPVPAPPPPITATPAQPRTAPQPASTRPAARAPAPATRTETRPTAPPPPAASIPAPPPVAVNVPREPAPSAPTAPPPPMPQTAQGDSCTGLAGLKLEQCRSCREGDRVWRALCAEKVRFTYCLRRGAGSAECQQAPSRTEGGS